MYINAVYNIKFCRNVRLAFQTLGKKCLPFVATPTAI